MQRKSEFGENFFYHARGAASAQHRIPRTVARRPQPLCVACRRNPQPSKSSFTHQASQGRPSRFRAHRIVIISNFLRIDMTQADRAGACQCLLGPRAHRAASRRTKCSSSYCILDCMHSESVHASHGTSMILVLSRLENSSIRPC